MNIEQRKARLAVVKAEQARLDELAKALQSPWMAGERVLVPAIVIDKQNGYPGEVDVYLLDQIHQRLPAFDLLPASAAADVPAPQPRTFSEDHYRMLWNTVAHVVRSARTESASYLEAYCESTLLNVPRPAGHPAPTPATDDPFAGDFPTGAPGHANVWDEPPGLDLAALNEAADARDAAAKQPAGEDWHAAATAEEPGPAPAVEAWRAHVSEWQEALFENAPALLDTVRKFVKFAGKADDYTAADNEEFNETHDAAKALVKLIESKLPF